MTLPMIVALVAVVLFAVASYLAADRAIKFLALGLALLALAHLVVR